MSTQLPFQKCARKWGCFQNLPVYQKSVPNTLKVHIYLYHWAQVYIYIYYIIYIYIYILHNIYIYINILHNIYIYIYKYYIKNVSCTHNIPLDYGNPLHAMKIPWNPHIIGIYIYIYPYWRIDDHAPICLNIPMFDHCIKDSCIYLYIYIQTYTICKHVYVGVYIYIKIPKNTYICICI